MNQVVFYNSKLKYTLLLLLGIVCALTSIFVIVVCSQGNPKTMEIGWWGFILSVLGSIVFVWQIVDTRPHLMLNEDGLFASQLIVGTIAWADIEDAYIRSVRQHYYSTRSLLCLCLNDEKKYTSKLSRLKRSFLLLNAFLGYPAFVIDISDIKADPQTICDSIKERSAQAKSEGKS